MTCLCLTRNRRQWLPKAIACFQNQTHQNRELLILSDGEDVRDLIPPDERIRLIHFDGQLEIGDKRNRGCELARGEVIAHYDDDDFSAPGRLADQLQRLADTGKAVTGFNSMRFTDGSRWWLYRGSPDYIVGTSLCYRKEWWMKSRFLPVQLGEDNDFGEKARGAGQAVSVDARDLMYATIHAGNSSARDMDGNPKQWIPVDPPSFGAAA